MGKRLVEYFRFVKEKAGQDGVMRLAMKTRMPSIVAADQPDAPETVARFRQAVKEITGLDVNL